MQAFYFSTEERELRYGDGRVITVGATHSVSCTPKCCERGLHASVKLIDAVKYAPGSILYLVDVTGSVDSSSDKISGQNREYIAEFDAEDLLRKFARNQALINIEKIKPYCTVADYELIIKFLHTGAESLRSAAGSAAWSAAWSAAGSAAWSAAGSAAESAARSAARSAAESAARSAAWSAAGSAAESAARSAAWSAAWSAAGAMLSDMVKEATGWDI